MKKNLSFKTQFLFKALEKTKFGRIQLIIEDTQSSYEFGTDPFISKITFINEDVLLKTLKEGDIGLAESFIKNDITISNTTEFIKWACLNDELLHQTFHGSFWGTLWHKIDYWLKPNTVKGARENIMAHYDLGNHFYSQWLDKTMSYSSAVFDESSLQNQTLSDAQNAKYDRLIQVLDIKPGDKVLEIGCGWGGFFSRAIQTKDCHVTAVMNSPAQHQYNLQLIEKNNFKKNINLQLMDYRQIEGKFDKIVSIEMIEAVGEKYWPTYFSKIKYSLKPKGKATIQSITINENRFEDYKNTSDFIKKYIFPGGMLLTNNKVKENAEKQNLKFGPIYEFGLSYAETLKRWHENFNHSILTKQLDITDQKFINLWNFYLNYCEGAFLAKRINVAHFELEN